MKTILIIEDDHNLAKAIKNYLEIKDYNPIVVHKGLAAQSFVLKSSTTINLILLDIYLEDSNGLDICHTLRNNGIDIPIIITTQETATDSLITAFERGVDDYVKKPFDIVELEARIKRLLENTQRKKPNIIKAGNYELDINQRIVRKDGKELFLSRRQFDLLLFFAKNPGTVLSRDTIISNVWNFDEELYPNTV
ncbi:response regulator transcription factor, partial [Candidatus Dojkabacteria bacterium]|nr:response regulator transcription factor [Candidatus Dojkabacteria bacterium]